MKITQIEMAGLQEKITNISFCLEALCLSAIDALYLRHHWGRHADRLLSYIYINLCKAYAYKPSMCICDIYTRGNNRSVISTLYLLLILLLFSLHFITKISLFSFTHQYVEADNFFHEFLSNVYNIFMPSNHWVWLSLYIPIHILLIMDKQVDKIL